MSEAKRPSFLRLGVWAVFFGLMALWAAQNVFDWGPQSPLIGQPAPTFEAPIVAGDGEGDRVALEPLRGRAVMLDFWASWCPPCRASIPIVTRVAERHAADGLVTLGVNVERERSPVFVQRAHAALHAGFPSLHDTTGMQFDYGIQSLPTLILIDRRGVVRLFEVGVPDEEALDAHIREILREDP